MWSSSFDLHCHTTHSDGALSVEELADAMAMQQVRVWSLTDHDTIAGWDEARAAAAKERNIRFVPGVELTCAVELPWDENILEASSEESTTFLMASTRLLSIRSESRGSEEVPGMAFTSTG